ncbi:MAG: hypothetical protein V4547_16305 [Bacteroidota bacterium]
MNQLVSGLGSLNWRERIKGFLIFLATALLTFIWQAAQPFLAHFVATFNFDLSLLTTVVNWDSLVGTATTAAMAYWGITASTGEKGKLLTNKK